MNTPTSARSVLKFLSDHYPVVQQNQPLAIGIFKAIVALHPELDAKLLRAALHQHTSATAYLKGMSKATERFDLEGKVAGEVTEEQRKFALDQMKERIKKRNDALRAVELAKKAAEAEQLKAQKLAELAAKFGGGR